MVLSYIKLVCGKLLEVMIRIDPESTLKSDISIRGDLGLESCADTCAALTRLIRYIAAEGDFQSEFESSSENTSTSNSSVLTQDARSRSSGSQNDVTQCDDIFQINKSDTTKTLIGQSNVGTAQQSVQLDLLDAMDDDDFLVETRKSKSASSMQDSIELAAEFDDFVDLEAEPGIGFLRNKSRPDVRHFHPIQIKENHFRIPHERKDKLNPPMDFPKPDQRILIKELNLR